MDNEFLGRFNKKLEEGLQKVRDSRMEDERRRLMATIGQDLAKMMAPFLNDLARNAKMNKEDVREAMFEILGQVNAKELNIDTKPLVDAIQQAVMGIQIPEPKVSVVIPKDIVHVPDFPTEMSITGFSELLGLFRNQNDPISVQLRDRKGNPIDFSGLGVAAIGGGGGGKADYLTIKDIRGSSASLIDQTEGALRVVGSFTASIGSTYAALANPDGQITAANPLPVQIASGSTGGTQYDDAGNAAPGTGGLAIAVNSAGSTYALRVGSGDSATALRVQQATDSVSSTFIVDTAKSLDTIQVSGSIASTNIQQVNGSGVVVGTGYQDNALRVVHATDAVASTYIVDSAKALEVLQVSGSVHSTNILQVAGSAVVVGTGYQDNALRVVHATDAIVSTNLTQIGGSATVVGTGYQDNALRVVHATDAIVSTNIMQTAGAATVVGGGWKDNALRVVEAQDSVASSNIMQVNGSGVVVGTGYQDNALRVVHATDAIASVNVVSSVAVVVSSITASTAASIVDSSGVQYSGSNPVPITIVSGSITSTVATGPSPVGTTDDGTSPVQIAGIARTANPTKVSGGQVVKASTDALGRQIIRPVQARELIATSYTSLSTGTEATMATAAAATYLDLIQILASNSSDAAVVVDIRGVSAGNVVLSLSVPANGTAGISCAVPIPQQDTGNAWTADMPDITGTTVYLTALYSKEV